MSHEPPEWGKDPTGKPEKLPEPASSLTVDKVLEAVLDAVDRGAALPDTLGAVRDAFYDLARDAKSGPAERKCRMIAVAFDRWAGMLP